MNNTIAKTVLRVIKRIERDPESYYNPLAYREGWDNAMLTRCSYEQVQALYQLYDNLMTAGETT